MTSLSHENGFGVVKNTIFISTIGWLDKVIIVPSNKDPMVIIENCIVSLQQQILVRQSYSSSSICYAKDPLQEIYYNNLVYPNCSR